MKYPRISLFLFFVSAGYCATSNPPDSKLAILQDWSGGLNTNQSDHNLEKNESPGMRNILIDEYPGSIVKSNGYILSGTASGSGVNLSKVTGMFPFETSDGLKSMIVTDSSQVLDTTDFQTFTTVKTQLNTAVLLNCTQVRDKIMYDINVIKFSNPYLRNLLLTTGDRYLEETNWWKDDYWGVVNGQGLNKLGLILMKIRDEIKQQSSL